MTKHDAVWCDDHNKWIVRESRLRWVGDTVGMCNATYSMAETFADRYNKLGLKENFTTTELYRALGVTQ